MILFFREDFVGTVVQFAKKLRGMPAHSIVGTVFVIPVWSHSRGQDLAQNVGRKTHGTLMLFLPRNLDGQLDSHRLVLQVVLLGYEHEVTTFDRI